MSIEELRARISEVQKAIEPLNEQLSELKQQLLNELSPFKIGDVIRFDYGRNKQRIGRVVAINPWCLSDPMWVVRLIKMDGTEGELHKVYPYLNPKSDTLCPTNQTAKQSC